MTTLAAYLEERRRYVEEALAGHLPPADRRPRVLHEAMRYSMLAGGKRLRPLLCLAAAEACGGTPDQARWPALALEALHTYTLIHDDLPCMDDDDLRRGLPTCHVKFGEAQAVLAGDALLTLAFAWLARTPSNASFNTSDYVRELARAGGHDGVIAGQIEDLAGEDQEDPDAEDVNYIHRKKTGALIVASVRLGGMAAGAGAAELAGLTRYGEEAGLAFQVADDLLNATSTQAELGKAVGSDERRGKTTFVAVHGEYGARRRAGELADAAVTALAVFGPSADRLRELALHIVERKN